METNSWMLVEFNLGEKLFGDQAREASARLLDLENAPVDIVKRLMHYGKKEAAGGFAPVKFLGRKNGFALLGFDEAQDTVLEIAPQLATAWSISRGRHVTIAQRSGMNAIEARPYDIEYRLPACVVQKKPEQMERFRADPAAHLRAVVLNSIKRQSEVLGLTPPAALDCKILGWEGTSPARLGAGTAAFARVKNLRFTLNAMLNGQWCFGHLTARGYGALNADLSALERQSARLENSHVGQ